MPTIDLGKVVGPQGPQGPEGPQGAQGIQGEKGNPGTDGVNGADGYTPVKGVDYFTAEEIENIAGQAAGKVTTDESLSVAGKAADAAATGEALAGKAPAGYGLGGIAKQITADEVDSTTKNGNYRIAGVISVGGAGQTNPFLRVDCWDSNLCVQTLYSQDSPMRILKRQKSGGGWKEWEWVNPPMKLGVEYRTIERIATNPVYRKGINLGTIASGSNSIAHGIEGLTGCVEVQLTNTNGKSITHSTLISGVTVDATNITIVSTASASVVAYLRYVKE